MEKGAPELALLLEDEAANRIPVRLLHLMPGSASEILWLRHFTRTNLSEDNLLAPVYLRQFDRTLCLRQFDVSDNLMPPLC